VLLLVFLALRGRARPSALAFALLVACAAPLALSARAETRLGRPHFAPGLFAQECGFGPLFAGLGPTALWLLGSPLAVWSILRFSPLVPAFAISRLRRWRACPPVDLFVALGIGVALVLSLGLAAEEIQRGEVSTLVVREALYAVQVLAVGVDVGVLACLLGRRGRDGSRWALGVLAVAALALVPWTWRVSLHKSPPQPTVLSPGEVGALEHLRQQAPLDAVVAHLRGSARPELQAQGRGLHSLPLVAAMAGRRTVLEYYRPDIDPSVNRLRALRRLFVTANPAEGEALLQRFGVDYVLEYRFQPLHFESPRLRLAYERDEVRLWQVMRPSLGSRPGPRYAPLGLR